MEDDSFDAQGDLDEEQAKEAVEGVVVAFKQVAKEEVADVASTIGFGERRPLGHHARVVLRDHPHVARRSNSLKANVQGKSDYQDVLVFKSSTYGKDLVLASNS
ncbi:hypothetical protein ZIOFF_011521 [Zingiber officinale]|uniref:Spermidine synthase tetramerisation domain-containing protein n=1 Tax=Zingiber officinale TaxID=94328 RepID=A0A8J5M176_ZINOF|nr:hypothetical protein ZIOFF_011521 [Zingiber officinale]